MALTPEQIARAWKDKEYRLSLSKEELAQLPESPVVEVSLSDDELEQVAGGTAPSCPVGNTCDMVG